MTIGKAMSAAVAALGLGAASAPAPEPISMTADGFSSAPSRWRIDPDGSITDIRAAPSSLPTMPWTLVTRRTAPMPDRYRRIAALLKPVRAWVGRQLPCTQYVTDGSIGTVRWWSKAALNYYSGCGDAGNHAVVEQLFAASALIGGWVATAPVVERRDITTTEQLAAVQKEMAR